MNSRTHFWESLCYTHLLLCSPLPPPPLTTASTPTARAERHRHSTWCKHASKLHLLKPKDCCWQKFVRPRSLFTPFWVLAHSYLGKPPTLSGSFSQERFSIFFVLARFQYSTAGFKIIPRLAFKNEQESKLLFTCDLTSFSHNFFLTW